MRTLTAAAFLVVLCLLPSPAQAKTHTQARSTALHLVNKVYVEEMGASAEAARFRLLLEDQLSVRGFTIVDKPEQADAVLSGVLSVDQSGFYGGPADISVTPRLISSDGRRLWSTNIGGQIIILTPISSLKFKEPVEHRAKELAKKLRSDWQKSARAAGIK